MKGWFTFLPAVLGALALLLSGGPSGAEEETAGPTSYRVGVVSTFFRDVPEPMIPTMLRPIRGLLESQTGLEGTLTSARNWEHLAQQLDSGKLHLGLFHGFEFAWAQHRFPRLKPVVATVGEEGLTQVCLVVRQDSDLQKLDDLKGASLAVPRRTGEHCHVYLDRYCAEYGSTVANFFQRKTRPFTLEDAMLSLIQGRVAAVLTDGASLASYRRNRPDGYASLRVLVRSESFPPAVFVHRHGAVDEKVLQRFQQGMYQAHQSAQGKEIMTYCKIARFARVPDNYDKLLTASRETYPLPSVPTSK